jgi:hypothetical protein
MEMGWSVSEEVRLIVSIPLNQSGPLGLTDKVHLTIDVVIEACHVVLLTEDHPSCCVLSDADRAIVIRLIGPWHQKTGTNIGSTSLMLIHELPDHSEPKHRQ